MAISFKQYVNNFIRKGCFCQIERNLIYSKTPGDVQIVDKIYLWMKPFYYAVRCIINKQTCFQKSLLIFMDTKWDGQFSPKQTNKQTNKQKMNDTN